MDEMLVSSVPTIEGLKFQDVAKEGLKFGDEGELDARFVARMLELTLAGLALDDDADAKAEETSLQATFEPLAAYIRKELAESVDKGTPACLSIGPCLSLNLPPLLQSSSRPS
jgi:heat shock protein beta